MWIKICGITSEFDARLVQDAGAQAIGLNFYEKSRRFVGIPAASAIAESLAGSLDVVGIFVNADPDNIDRVCDQVSLTAIQLHGDETPDVAAAFQSRRPDVAVIRALRIGADSRSLADQLNPWKVLDPPLDAVLVDAFVDGEYGGTGQTVDPQHLTQRQTGARMILAGGLRPDNVRDAVQAVRPWGVDTAGGVEIEPGRKSESLIREFVRACRSAAPEMAPEHLRS